MEVSDHQAVHQHGHQQVQYRKQQDVRQGAFVDLGVPDGIDRVHFPHQDQQLAVAELGDLGQEFQSLIALELQDDRVLVLDAQKDLQVFLGEGELLRRSAVKIEDSVAGVRVHDVKHRGGVGGGEEGGQALGGVGFVVKDLFFKGDGVELRLRAFVDQPGLKVVADDKVKGKQHHRDQQQGPLEQNRQPGLFRVDPEPWEGLVSGQLHHHRRAQGQAQGRKDDHRDGGGLDHHVGQVQRFAVGKENRVHMEDFRHRPQEEGLGDRGTAVLIDLVL